MSPQELASILCSVENTELHPLSICTGACQHALGYHQEAVQDYERAFSIDSGNKDKIPDEARSQQFLAFYQKELALYIRKHLDDSITAFCPDKDLHPIFKVCCNPAFAVGVSKGQTCSLPNVAIAK